MACYSLRRLATFGLAVWLSASSASAFTLNGSSNLVGWDTDLLSLAPNLTSCGDFSQRNRVRGAVDEAVELWNAVATSSIRIMRGGDSSTTAWNAVTKNALDSPVIVCDADLTTQIGVDSSNIAGVGVGVAKDSGLKINYGYLLLNATPGDVANVNNLSDVVLKVVVAHEIGHVLGLGHTDDTSALMYFKASDKTSLALSQDDIDGISYLYPRGEFFGGSTPFGCASVRDVSGGPSGGGGGAGFLLAFFSLAWLLTRLVRRGFGRSPVLEPVRQA